MFWWKLKELNRKQYDRYYSCEDDELNPERGITRVKPSGDRIVFADSESTNEIMETVKSFGA